MNLRQIANRATSAINPNLAGIARISTGSTTGANGKPMQTYLPDAPITIQVQALSTKEIEHLDSLNIQGATCAAYSNLQLSAVDRTTQSGGDLVRFTNPATGQDAWYLVIAELEAWGSAGWSRVALRKQKDPIV